MDPLTGAMPVLPAGLSGTAPRVAALGGGHGLSASLKALRYLTQEISAIVTVADDGGSSGRLREEFGCLPPGDLRMALAALCDDSTDWGRTWRDAIQHRFQSSEKASELDGHALGNLLIMTLWDLLDDPVAGLQWAGALLGARGRVYPMSLTPLVIEGDVLITEGGENRREHVVGQVGLGHAGRKQRIESVSLQPSDAEPCPQALTALDEADWVVFGPGSWFTSVLPHVMLSGTRERIVESKARKILTMNVSADAKEADELSPADHIRVFGAHAPGLRLDVVLADPGTVGDHADFEQAAADLGARVHYAQLRSRLDPNVHDVLRLATAYREIFTDTEE